jgi:hypothetical protein
MAQMVRTYTKRLEKLWFSFDNAPFFSIIDKPEFTDQTGETGFIPWHILLLKNRQTEGTGLSALSKGKNAY